MDSAERRIILIGDAQSYFVSYWASYFGRRRPVTLIDTLPRAIPRSLIVRLPWLLREWRRLFARLRTHPPSIVCVHYVTLYSVPLLLLRRHRVVLHPYGTDFYWITWKRRLAVTDVVKKWLLTRLLRRADKVLVTSSSFGRFLTDHYGLEPHRTKVVSWGIEVRALERPSHAADVLPGLGIPLDRRLVLCNRELKPLHNQTRLVRAVGLLVAEGAFNGCHLAVVGSYGSESYVAQLRQLVVSNGLQGVVTVAFGYLSTADLASVLDRSELCCSLADTDQLSASLMEAMYLGCLPIVSDIPAYREIIREGANGLFVDQRDERSIATGIRHGLRIVEQGGSYKKINRELVEAYHDRAVQADRVYAEVVSS